MRHRVLLPRRCNHDPMYGSSAHLLEVYSLKCLEEEDKFPEVPRVVAILYRMKQLALVSTVVLSAIFLLAG
jgi:hypothetical protein